MNSALDKAPLEGVGLPRRARRSVCAARTGDRRPALPTRSVLLGGNVKSHWLPIFDFEGSPQRSLNMF